MTTDRIVTWRVTAAGIYAVADRTGILPVVRPAARNAGYVIDWMDMAVRRCMAGEEAKDRLGTRLPDSVTDAP